MQIRRFNRRNFIIGGTVLLVGFVMPRLFTVEMFFIPEDLLQAIRTQDSIPMLLAALKLVGVNILRSLPTYLGIFMIAESIDVYYKERKVFSVKAILMLIIVPALYRLIDLTFHVHYDFGIPAVVLTMSVFLFSRAGYMLVSLPKKLVMVTLFIMAVQCMDVMPVLTPFHVGEGDISKDVKLTAVFLERESVLQALATLFFFLFLLMGVLVLMMVRDENNLRRVSELKEQNERIRMEAQMQELTNRTYLEMRHLVHDLKSPMTSVQALISLAAYDCRQKGESQTAGYLSKAERSIDRMSGMISEILDDQQRGNISTKQLLDATLAQISVSEQSFQVEVENRAPEQQVCVNRTCFVRALVNLIENAFHAVDPEQGKVQVWVKPGDRGAVLFAVQDNGCGIDKAYLKDIWRSGFSTGGSHGLGLSFVQKVVSDSQGTITVSSRKGEGTLFVITLPTEANMT